MPCDSKLFVGSVGIRLIGHGSVLRIDSDFTDVLLGILEWHMR